VMTQFPNSDGAGRSIAGAHGPFVALRPVTQSRVT
jgi:hypothetical protein